MKNEIEIRDTRNGDWHWINNKVTADPHLTPAEKVVYSALCTFGGFSEIRPNYETIAERSALSVRMCKTAIKKLSECGYLYVENLGIQKKSNVYFLLKAIQGCDKCKICTYSKVQDFPKKVQTTTEISANSAPHIDKGIDKDKDKSAKQGFAGNSINEVMVLFKAVNPSYEKLFENKTQRAAIQRLLSKWGKNELVRILTILAQTNAARYAPVITTPLELENSAGRLAAFLQRREKETPKLIEI